MASKGWAGALTLALAFQAQAGDGKGLLETIGRALGNTPRVAAEKARSPYLEPAGTYTLQIATRKVRCRVTRVEDAHVEVEIAPHTRVRVVKATLTDIVNPNAKPAND